MDRLTAKTSTIFISIGDHTRVYRSMEEVPARLRKKLMESTSSLNSATIVIADGGGREELSRAIAGLPGGLQSRLPAALRGLRLPKGGRADGRPAWRFWADLLLLGSTGLLIWLAFVR